MTLHVFPFFERALAHPTPTGNEVDERTQERQEDDGEDPRRLAPARKGMVAEDVPGDGFLVLLVPIVGCLVYLATKRQRVSP